MVVTNGTAAAVAETDLGVVEDQPTENFKCKTVFSVYLNDQFIKLVFWLDMILFDLCCKV